MNRLFGEGGERLAGSGGSHSCCLRPPSPLLHLKGDLSCRI
jgi:hypothetical protein